MRVRNGIFCYFLAKAYVVLNETVLLKQKDTLELIDKGKITISILWKFAACKLLYYAKYNSARIAIQWFHFISVYKNTAV